MKTTLSTLLFLVFAAPAFAGSATEMHVSKDPNCGCCTEWIAIMEKAGFEVTVTDVPNSELARLKAASGLSPEMASCHTAKIDGYVIEGHVPAADIQRLLEERPTAIGLTVPGMPYGSPGMGPETAREAFDVLLIGEEGQTEVFSHYEAGAGRG